MVDLVAIDIVAVIDVDIGVDLVGPRSEVGDLLGLAVGLQLGLFGGQGVLAGPSSLFVGGGPLPVDLEAAHLGEVSVLTRLHPELLLPGFGLATGHHHEGDQDDQGGDDDGDDECGVHAPVCPAWRAGNHSN